MGLEILKMSSKMEKKSFDFSVAREIIWSLRSGRRRRRRRGTKQQQTQGCNIQPCNSNNNQNVFSNRPNSHNKNNNNNSRSSHSIYAHLQEESFVSFMIW